MGMNKYIYIGPVLLVPKRTDPVTRDVIIDENGRETRNAFNPVTGEQYPVIPKTEVITQEPEAYIDDEDVDLDEDTFWSPEYCGDKNSVVFLCNGEGSELDDDDVMLSLSDLDIPVLVDEFRTKYKKFIHYYESKYGPIKVDYAAVSYWS